MVPHRIRCLYYVTQKILYSGGEPTVQENVNGITLGVFTVDDIDHNDSHTYLLTNDGAGKFILSQTGHLSVSEGTDISLTNIHL